MWVYAVAEALCFVRWERDLEGDRNDFEVERVSADLRDSVLLSSGELISVDFRLRDRERAADCVCLAGECDRVREDVVAEVGVSGMRLEVVEGGLASSGGGNGRGWWRVETIVLVNVVKS